MSNNPKPCGFLILEIEVCLRTMLECDNTLRVLAEKHLKSKMAEQDIKIAQSALPKRKPDRSICKVRYALIPNRTNCIV